MTISREKGPGECDPETGECVYSLSGRTLIADCTDDASVVFVYVDCGTPAGHGEDAGPSGDAPDAGPGDEPDAATSSPDAGAGGDGGGGCSCDLAGEGPPLPVALLLGLVALGLIRRRAR